MRLRMAPVFLLLLSASTGLFHAVQASVANFTDLGMFNEISLQLPLTGQVNVSTDGSYVVSIDAVDELINATSVTLNHGNLTIALKPNSTIKKDFTSPQTINITVPEGSLSGIAVSSTGSLTVDGHTIYPAATLYTTNIAKGAIVITNATASGVNSIAAGSGLTMVTGNLGTVLFTSLGSGASYLQGNLSGVNATVTGGGNLYVSSSGSPTIQGTASRKSSVQYDNGSCNLKGCSQTKTINLPSRITSNPKGTISVYETTDGNASAQDASSGEGEGGDGGTGEGSGEGSGSSSGEGDGGGSSSGSGEGGGGSGEGGGSSGGSSGGGGGGDGGGGGGGGRGK